MVKDVVIVRGDDWEGFYVDGNLYAEGHSLDAYDVLSAFGYIPRVVCPDSDWLEKQGSLPLRVEDLKLRVR